MASCTDKSSAQVYTGVCLLSEVSSPSQQSAVADAENGHYPRSTVKVLLHCSQDDRSLKICVTATAAPQAGHAWIIIATWQTYICILAPDGAAP